MCEAQSPFGCPIPMPRTPFLWKIHLKVLLSCVQQVIYFLLVDLEVGCLRGHRSLAGCYRGCISGLGTQGHRLRGGPQRVQSVIRRALHGMTSAGSAQEVHAATHDAGGACCHTRCRRLDTRGDRAMPATSCSCHAHVVPPRSFHHPHASCLPSVHLDRVAH